MCIYVGVFCVYVRDWCLHLYVYVCACGCACVWTEYCARVFALREISDAY